jgi:transcriptional regulator with XRE-family HTH domain
MPTNNPSPWKAMREAAGLSQREIGRRAGINSGRLSVIERGLVPTDEEATKLRAVLAAALDLKGEKSA